MNLLAISQIKLLRMAHALHTAPTMTTSRLAAIGAALLMQATAYAQTEPTPAEPTPDEPTPDEPTPDELTPAPSPAASAPARAAPAVPAVPAVTLAGYLEAYYQAHFQNPSNRTTNLRGYDNRSRSFTLSNIALDVKGERGPVTVRIVLQVGHTPSTYYLAEPVSPGTGAVNASSSELWKYVQTATVAVKGPRDTTIEAGLFTSPIGLEVFPVKDNWNLSRSNLFFGLPAYHAGARVSLPLGDTGWTGTLHVYNGWNTVVDNNDTPSVAASAGYASASTTAQLLYFGGIERATGAPEGKPWRHLFDALGQHAVTRTVSVAAHASAGIEPNDLGTSSWLAGAVYGKLALSSRLYLAVRADYFYETLADDDGTTAGAIFWLTRWVAEGTATLAYQPAEGVSLRLEYRHDQADSDAFFGGAVSGDGSAAPFVLNRSTQDTATLGVTAWF